MRYDPKNTRSSWQTSWAALALVAGLILSCCGCRLAPTPAVANAPWSESSATPIGGGDSRATSHGHLACSDDSLPNDNNSLVCPVDSATARYASCQHRKRPRPPEHRASDAMPDGTHAWIIPTELGFRWAILKPTALNPAAKRPFSVVMSNATPGLIRGQSDGNLPLQYQFSPRDQWPRELFGHENLSNRARTQLGQLIVDIQSDHFQLYSTENLRPVAIWLATAAVMAHSGLDTRVLETTQNVLPSFASSPVLRGLRTLGNGYTMLPIYAGTAVVGSLLADRVPAMSTAATWSERSIRGILVGTPPLLAGQYLLGSSRPGESPRGPRWNLFGDTNGISGHGFMGAVPFLTAYHMARTRSAKILWLALSTVPALTRVTDNSHYPSQAILGWGLAYLSTRAVIETDGLPCDLSLAPTFGPREIGMRLTLRR